MIRILRNEIWSADLKESYKNITAGVHPVLIISSYKHIMKANTVNVLPITSQFKNQINHIKIEGYGLEKQSVILAEQIITINKSDLINRIGALDGINIKEVNKALKNQLQLENSCLSAEELKKIFKLQFHNIGQLNNLTILRNNIKEDYIKKNYDICISLCNELIEEANRVNIDNKQEFLWYGNYALSLMFIKENLLEQAIIYANKSLEYIDNVDVTYQNYTLSMWALARCYEEIDPCEAKEIYNALSYIYEKTSNKKMKLSCLFSVAYIDKDMPKMNSIIKFIMSNKSSKWYFGEEKETLLKQMQMQLNAVKGI